MRFIYFLLISTACLAQKPKNNYILLNAGNSTPFVGAEYRRAFQFSKKDSLKVSHFEAGVGVGWIPAIFQYPSSLPIAYSHSFNYIMGKRLIFLSIGYAGIFAPRDRFINERFVYTPNPSVGIRLKFLENLVLGLNFNGYFYGTKSDSFINEKDLVRHYEYKAALSPGAYIGYKF